MGTLELKSNLHTLIDSINDSTILDAAYKLLSKIKVDDKDDSTQAILDNIKRGLDEVKLAKEGKLKTTPAREFLDEL